MKAKSPQPVKYFIGALFSDKSLLDEAVQLCGLKIGATDPLSEAFPFEVTHYYDQEMGAPIYRSFFSFEPLFSPGKLADLKIICNGIEEQLMVQGRRKVNLDIGYLDLHKLVLASAKYNGQKLYLGQGIYADLTLIFEHGKFRAVDNTFPDFRSGQYEKVFMEFRNSYKTQLKFVK